MFLAGLASNFVGLCVFYLLLLGVTDNMALWNREYIAGIGLLALVVTLSKKTP